MPKSTEEIIASFPPDEDTFEYWIVQARDGRNVAECWQNCYRIAKLSAVTDQKEIEKKINQRIEQLADIEHQRWSDRQKYLHSKCTMYIDEDGEDTGNLVISSDDVQHWEKQIKTPLSECCKMKGTVSRITGRYICSCCGDIIHPDGTKPKQIIESQILSAAKASNEEQRQVVEDAQWKG